MSGCAWIRYKINFVASGRALSTLPTSKTAVTGKKSSLRNRRVWRMSTEMPMGGIVESVPAAAAPAEAEVEPPEPSKIVLKLPSPPSWRASSYDLLTGSSVSEVDDTIPGDLFDELFGDHGDQR